VYNDERQLGTMLTFARYHIFRDSATSIGWISFDKDWIGEQTSKIVGHADAYSQSHFH